MLLITTCSNATQQFRIRTGPNHSPGASHSFQPLADTVKKVAMFDPLRTRGNRGEREFGQDTRADVLTAYKMSHEVEIRQMWELGEISSGSDETFNSLEYEIQFPPHCVLTVRCFSRHRKGQ